MRPTPLTFKIASEDWEFDQVHRLNYDTFVEEIPQHDPNSDRVLVDPFHAVNTYFLCLQGRDLVGMVSINDQRPFSLDRKLEKLSLTLEELLPGDSSVCEIRLLAVIKEKRSGRVMQGLLTMLARHCIDHEFDIAIISGTVTQQRFYQRLGFLPFGPLVGTTEAQFQPMYIEIKHVERNYEGRYRPGLETANTAQQEQLDS